MSHQPAEEQTMNEHTEIRARLIAACDTDVDVVANIVRERLERCTKSGLAEALAPHGI